MASKENKCKYDEEEEVSIATSKKRWTFGDYNDDNGDDDNSSSSSRRRSLPWENPPSDHAPMSYPILQAKPSTHRMCVPG
jgi:hypothetical protein